MGWARKSSSSFAKSRTLFSVLVVVAVAVLHTEALSSDRLRSVRHSTHHQSTLVPPAVRSHHHTSLRRNQTATGPVWLPLQLQVFGVRSLSGEARLTSDKDEIHSNQEHLTHVPAELAIAAVFHETSTTPELHVRATTTAVPPDDFESNLAKLREQRVADEQRRIRAKMASRESEKDRFERGDIENAKAAAQAAKTLSAVQAETANQRKVIQHALAGLPEEQQPEAHNPDLDVASLKANVVAGFAKTGGMTPLVAQVLADV
eukprot:INCI3904.1.p1 GENE.INCI3904.1~~INCI3904.1.p1  ORF type:complete len:261 (-),score=50.33 INCI3904.1:137-919(-)